MTAILPGHSQETLRANNACSEFRTVLRGYVTTVTPFAAISEKFVLDL